MTQDAVSPQDLAVHALLGYCAERLLRNPDAEDFMHHLADVGPALFPEAVTDDPAAVMRAPGQRVLRADAPQFFRSLAWAVASSMPLPSNGWKAQRGKLPGRNDPCVCGSLRKFKLCCERLLQQAPDLDRDHLASLVVAAMPAKDWPALAGGAVPAAALVQAAHGMAEAGDPRRALRLLEPWAKLPAPWPADRVDLLDVLADLYLELGNPRKRKALAMALVERGDTAVQSLGWQRLSMMASDAGDADAARQAFERAQRLTPDDPRVALLEVTTLLAAGELDRAHERAAFHARRLQRLPGAAGLQHEIDGLLAIARGEMDHVAQGVDDPGDDSDDAGFEGLPFAVGELRVFDDLRDWVLSSPPPQLRLDLSRASDADLGALQPAASLHAALKAWRKAVALPQLDVVTWSQVLKRHPALLDSFEVLDDALNILDQVPFGLAASLQAALLNRGLDIWDALRSGHPRARCEWAWHENRPALRLLQRRVELDASPLAQSSFEVLEAMVTILNPTDNQGLRQRLAAVLLRRGRAADALALAERYPDDFVGMQLLHARSLLALQRLDEAGPVFDAALRRNPHVLKRLQASRAPTLPDVASYAVGSDDEARITLAEQHDLWKDPAVRQWVAARVNGAAAQPGLF